jgi:formylglycine-generating enzyme required for sulfatase activity
LKQNAIIFILIISGFFSACTSTAKNTAIPVAIGENSSSTQLAGLPPDPSVSPTLGSNWQRPADGMLMVFVPAGEFAMGSNKAPDEQPIHTVYLDDYWIDQTEVTNAMYAKCVAGGVCDRPIRSNTIFRDSYYDNAEFANYPVIYVSQDDARDYCAWVGSRLPTEAEWEKAARGTDERTYPWGDSTPTCQMANFQGCNNDTVVVGSYPAAASPYGALDMAGNVWEFVNDWYGEAYYSQSPSSNPPGPVSGDGGYVILRGGSWNVGKDFLRSAYRLDDGPGNQYPNFGFRCSRSLP